MPADVEPSPPEGGPSNSPFLDHVFPAHRHRVFARLTPVIGTQAALVRARASSLLFFQVLVGFAIIAMATVTKFLGGVVLFSITLILCAAWLVVTAWVVRLGQRADRLARQFVSAEVGYDIGHITGSGLAVSWQRSVDRMQKRHERQQHHGRQ